MDNHTKKVITGYNSDGPAAAVRVGEYLYTSGITASEDGSGSIAADFTQQLDAIVRRLGGVLEKAGAGWADVVKLNCYIPPEIARQRNVVQTALRGLASSAACAYLAAPVPLADPACQIQIELIARIGGTKQRIQSVSGAAVPAGWAHAVRAGNTLYLSGQTGAIFSNGGVIPPTGGVETHTFKAYGALGEVLAAAGASWDEVIQVHQFLTPRQLSIPELQAGRTPYLKLGRFLSTSVACWPDHPDWDLGEWIIMVDLEAERGSRSPVTAEGVWGNEPGIHGFRVGPLLRIHGQVARDFSGVTQHESDASAQAAMCYRHLERILEAAGMTWRNVVHVRTFCRERKDIDVTRRIRAKSLPGGGYAATDLVAEFFDPKLLVEVEIVAIDESPRTSA